jgi:hypothetical protein
MSTWSQIAAKAMSDQVETFATDSPVSYTVTGGTPVTSQIQAAFSEGFVDGEAGSPYARLFILPSSLPAGAKRGDTVLVNGITFSVIEIVARANQTTKISLKK